MSKPTRSQSQWILAGCFGALALIGLYILSQVLNSSGSVAARTAPSGVTTTMIAERTRAASPEMSWINDATTRLKRMEEQQASLQAELIDTRRESAREREELERQSDELLSRYEKQIAALTAQLDEQKTGSVLGQGAAPEVENVAPGEFIRQAAVALPGLVQSPLSRQVGQRDGQEVQTAADPLAVRAPDTPFTREFSLTGGNNRPKDKRKQLENYLPAGSYAPALVLSGVDAPTTVSSQTDPIPVLFRITGPAVTAGIRRTDGQQIDLTGCTVTGSARGDLSSERVLVRLIKMSCALPNGSIFEEAVAGYMSGNGKTGVRGHVVSREGPLVARAGVAGVLSGLAEGISQAGTAGANSEQASFDEAIRGAGTAAVAGGAGNAASTLSEYYIERAEQYQPVVSLYGGTKVELVFMEGVDLDG